MIGVAAAMRIWLYPLAFSHILDCESPLHGPISRAHCHRSVFYLVSIFDMGKPSNITVTGGISFNYGKDKDGEQREQPQVYRDLEASAVLPVQAGKTRADSPVIV